jgi:GTP pyrophosphokinase
MQPLPHCIIEKAIILASESFAKQDHLIKPALFHSIRVGCWLYARRYETSIVTTGFLHDLVEDTDVTEEMIYKEFGPEVACLVMANTKNDRITDNTIKNDELIKRCLETSEKAAIVKAADIIDNFTYYSELNDQDGIEYCRRNVLSFKKYFKNTYHDSIFTMLFEMVV